ncbi:MAG: hypothetical protein COC06_06980 [Bacteroidales bacterium]|nr:MAG: hypothetical protein COC06_06980 [Bacteroidales bacterium]
MFSTIGLVISFAANVLDLLLAHHLYPIWVNWFSLFTISSSLVLIVLSLTNRINKVTAFVIFGYIFTFNIYLPGFWGNDEMRQTIISSFTNLGACFVYVIFIGLTGERKHTVILSGLNISAISFLFIIGHPVTESDYINIFIFLAASVFIVYILSNIEKALTENEVRRKKIIKYEQKLNEIHREEEQKRISFLTMINSDSTIFINKIITKLEKVLTEKEKTKKDKLVLEQIQDCKSFKGITSQLELTKQIEDVDSGFYTRTREKYTQLTDIELHICYLLRFSLSTNDIAERLNKGTETIKWYRKRIRKKLELSPNVNLSEFCNQI